MGTFVFMGPQFWVTELEDQRRIDLHVAMLVKLPHNAFLPSNWGLTYTVQATAIMRRAKEFTPTTPLYICTTKQTPKRVYFCNNAIYSSIFGCTITQAATNLKLNFSHLINLEVVVTQNKTMYFFIG